MGNERKKDTAKSNKNVKIEFRSFSGSGNNKANINWGQADTPLLRKTKPGYADGKSSLAGQGRANPRVISNTLCVQSESKPSRNGLTNFVWAWGQFIDHELDLTDAAEPMEEENIVAPYNDPELPNGIIEFKRSQFDAKTGQKNPRQQLNQHSSYLDASNVYGPLKQRADVLRTNDGTGKLKVQETIHGHFPPFNTFGLPNAPGNVPNPEEFFIAGDIRANEHAVLICMHTLFIREHNRLCDEITNEMPDYKGSKDQDEYIFQRARRIVGAFMHVITYEEFLPVLLGPNAISPYTGYKTKVNSSVSNLFSTACYRVGHTMLPEEINVANSLGSITLREAFFNPGLVLNVGIAPFLKGIAQQVQQEVDIKVVESIRSFLFGPPDPVGGRLLDLASLNIQRGRDHGLPDYNQCRKDFGLSKVNSFAEITSDPELQSKLQSVFGNVNDIDPWVGSLAEDHFNEANVGELNFAVLKDQFTRLRDGDRFWYENDPAFTAEEIDELKSTTLADIVRRNTDITNIQDNVFLIS